MLKIGVSACFMYPDPARTVFGHKTLTYLESDMAKYLARKGVMPILIPDVDVDLLQDYLAQMDGFVFQGGADLAPQSYGEAPIENGRWPGDRHRDEYELRIMKYAFDHRKPTFGICRGFQLMNVFFGGTLHQDLGIQTQTPVKHRDAALYDRISHTVTPEKGGHIASLYGEHAITVNTVHHQGVKKLGKDLVVDAVCPEDQLVEAFHYQGRDPEQYFVGVQWHPEFSHTLAAQVASPEPLYSDFLKSIRRNKK